MEKLVLLAVIDEPVHSDGYFHLRFIPGTREGDTFRHLPTDHPLSSFQISCQADTDKRTAGGCASYAHRVEFRPYCVTVDNVESMAKILRRTAKRMDDSAVRFGYPQSYGEYVLRAAAALGVGEIAFKTESDGILNWFSSGEGAGLASARYKADRMITDWRAKRGVKA